MCGRVVKVEGNIAETAEIYCGPRFDLRVTFDLEQSVWPQEVQSKCIAAHV